MIDLGDDPLRMGKGAKESIDVHQDRIERLERNANPLIGSGPRCFPIFVRGGSVAEGIVATGDSA